MVHRRTYPQYGGLASADVRQVLLAGALHFVRRARALVGVQSIALIGSLATDKRFPKDVDMLVIVADGMALDELARAGRQLSGAAQQINSGADVFLADPRGTYLGRTCPWRKCGPGTRVRCGAAYRSDRHYLRDDLHAVELPRELIASPPVELWPKVGVRVAVPDDVDALLLQPLRADSTTSPPDDGLQGTPGGS